MTDIPTGYFQTDTRRLRLDVHPVESNSYADPVATHAYCQGRSHHGARRGRSRRPGSNRRHLLGRQRHSHYATPTYITVGPRGLPSLPQNWTQPTVMWYPERDSNPQPTASKAGAFANFAIGAYPGLGMRWSITVPGISRLPFATPGSVVFRNSPACFAAVTWACCLTGGITNLYQRLASGADLPMSGDATGIRTQD